MWKGAATPVGLDTELATTYASEACLEAVEALTTSPKFVPEAWRSGTVMALQALMVGADKACVMDGTMILHLAAAVCCSCDDDEIASDDVLGERDAVRTAVKPLLHSEASIRVAPMRRRAVVADTESGVIE